MTKKRLKPTIWGGYTKVRNATFNLPKAKPIYEVVSPKGSATLAVANESIAKYLAESYGKGWFVRRRKK